MHICAYFLHTPLLHLILQCVQVATSCALPKIGTPAKALAGSVAFDPSSFHCSLASSSIYHSINNITLITCTKVEFTNKILPSYKPSSPKSIAFVISPKGARSKGVDYLWASGVFFAEAVDSWRLEGFYFSVSGELGRVLSLTVSLWQAVSGHLMSPSQLSAPLPLSPCLGRTPSRAILHPLLSSSCGHAHPTWRIHITPIVTDGREVPASVLWDAITPLW